MYKIQWVNGILCKVDLAENWSVPAIGTKKEILDNIINNQRIYNAICGIIKEAYRLKGE